MTSSPSSSSDLAPDIIISQALSADDCSAIVELQRAVWAASTAIVPVSQLIAAAHAGGTVLLARDRSRSHRPVGFCYGFVGLDASIPVPAGGSTPLSHSGEQDALGNGPWGEPILWSHMLAVLAEYRGRGLGRRLKHAQAEMARRRGLSRVLWTFDPLEAANAHLNLAGLGAVAARYSVDRYGPLEDVLNAGLATDRLIADWWVGAAGRTDELATPPGSAPSASPWILNPGAPDGPVPEAAAVRDHDGPVLIGVPAGGWRDDPERARAWRMNVRTAFMSALEAGYIALDITFRGSLAYYRLERP